MRIFAAVMSFYGLDDAALSRHHDPHVARAVAAWLCRRHTEASLRELAAPLGLSRPDSVPNLTRRIETRLKTSPELSNDLAEILKRASSPDVGVHQHKAKRTKSSRQLTRSKTKNQGTPRMKRSLAANSRNLIVRVGGSVLDLGHCTLEPLTAPSFGSSFQVFLC